MQYTSDHNSRQVTHRQEDNHNCERLPQGVRGLRPLSGPPGWGVLHRKMSLQNRVRRLQNTEALLLKEEHDTSHCESQQRGYSSLKEPGSDPLADFGNRDFPWGLKHWQQPTYGSLFYHKNTGAQKHHFEVLPLACQHPGFIQPLASWHQPWESLSNVASCSGTQSSALVGQQPLHKEGQSARPGASPAYQHTLNSWSQHRQKGPNSPQREHS